MNWLDEPLHAFLAGGLAFTGVLLLLAVGAWWIGALDCTISIDDGDW